MKWSSDTDNENESYGQAGMHSGVILTTGVDPGEEGGGLEVD